MYINDRWRVKPGLTLNLGFRWEPWLPWPDDSTWRIGSVISQADYAAGIHSTRFPNLPPGYVAVGDPGVPPGVAPNDWKMFDPCIGLAWDVRGDGKTSIRAGAGLYREQPFGRMGAELENASGLFGYAYTITDPTVPWYSPYSAAP